MTKNTSTNIIKIILLLAVIYFIYTKIKQNKMKKENDDSFIKNTANDYDLPYCDVESIYKKCGGDLISFYEKLEKFITNKLK
jgi:hypothetical protein